MDEDRKKILNSIQMIYSVSSPEISLFPLPLKTEEEAQFLACQKSPYGLQYHSVPVFTGCFNLTCAKVEKSHLI